MKTADIHILHQSGFYRVMDFKCYCKVCSVTSPEYNNSFTLSFIRAGFFEYQTFRRRDELHAGRLLLSKPGYEHTTRHIDDHPDIVTIFEFRRSFFDETIVNLYGDNLPWILRNNDLHSLMVNTTPELEYLHQHLLKKLQAGKASSLETDERVLALLEKVLQLLGAAETPASIPDRVKQHHIATIEKARDYLLQHFREPVSLEQLAAHCLVSPFHFSRLFKAFTKESPHQYLNAVRLVHARVLLAESNAPVADIAYECGFNSPEHFVTAFKQFHKIRPSAVRNPAV